MQLHGLAILLLEDEAPQAGVRDPAEGPIGVRPPDQSVTRAGVAPPKPPRVPGPLPPREPLKRV